MADRITNILSKRTDTKVPFTEVISRAMMGRTTFGEALNQFRADELKLARGEQDIDLAERQMSLAEQEFDFNRKKFNIEYDNADARAFEERFEFWSEGLSKQDQANLYNYARNAPEDVTADTVDRVLSLGIKELNLSAPATDTQDWKFGNVYLDNDILMGRQNERTGVVQVMRDGKWINARGGRFIGKGGESEAGIASLVGDEFSLDPIQTEPTADVEFGQATGATGFFGGIANTITDALGWGLQAPEMETADTAIQKLMKEANLVLAAEIPGRPSNYVRQRLQELEINTRSLMEGDARSLLKLSELRDFMAEQHNQAVWVAGNGAFEQGDRALAARNARQLRLIVNELDTIQQRWLEKEARDLEVGGEETIEGVPVRRVK